MNWEIGTDTYTLLCIKQVTNENLMYLQGIFLGSQWWPKWEGNQERRDTCIHTANSLYYIVETNTTLWNNYTLIKSNFIKVTRKLKKKNFDHLRLKLKYSLIFYVVKSI